MSTDETPYFDAQGRPQLADAFVLFFDLLGTRALRSPEEARNHLMLTRDAVERARSWSMASDNDKSDVGSIYSFSDNFGLGYPVYGAWEPTAALGFLITDIGFLQLAFLHGGFFARGAIARDGFFADPALEFIHGPALERAVNLEKTRARYPRVILDEASIATASHALVSEEGGSVSSGWRDQLLVDEEGVVFVNYLFTLVDDFGPEATDYLELHRQLIESNLCKHDGIPDVEEKYRWLGAYHNYFIGEYAEPIFGRPLAERLMANCSRPLGSFTRFGKDVEPIPTLVVGGD